MHLLTSDRCPFCGSNPQYEYNGRMVRCGDEECLMSASAFPVEFWVKRAILFEGLDA